MFTALMGLGLSRKPLRGAMEKRGVFLQVNITTIKTAQIEKIAMLQREKMWAVPRVSLYRAEIELYV